MPGSSPAQPARITRRHFLTGAGVLAAGMTFYAGEIARHEVDVVSRPIAIRNLPSAFHGYRIVQISDIHLDEYTEPLFLEHIVQRINKLAPDLVLLTGDFITHGAFSFLVQTHAVRRCAEIISTLKAPLRYAVLGNHDVSFNGAIVAETLRQHHTPVLINQHIALEKGGDRLWICGLEDPGTSHPDIGLTVPDNPGAPVILMSHEPDFADNVLAHPKAPFVDLILSGHSHGGQVRVPFAGPLILPPMGRIYPEGLYQLKNIQLYVNRGIGTVGLPFRLNCPPEITHITLESA